MHDVIKYSRDPVVKRGTLSKSPTKDEDAVSLTYTCPRTLFTSSYVYESTPLIPSVTSKFVNKD